MVSLSKRGVSARGMAGRLPSTVSSTPSSASRRERSAANAGSVPQPRALDVDRRVERDVAVGQNRDAVGEQDRLVDVVRDEQHRGPVARAELGEQRVHADARRARRARRTARRAATARARARARGRAQPVAPLRPRASWASRARGPRSSTSRERGRPALAYVGAAQSEHDVVEHACPRQEPCVLEHDGAPRGNDRVALGCRRRGRRARAAACSCRVPLRPSSATNSPSRSSRFKSSSTTRDPNARRDAGRAHDNRRAAPRTAPRSISGARSPR